MNVLRNVAYELRRRCAIPHAVPTQAVSTQAVSTQAVSTQAVSTHAVPLPPSAAFFAASNAAALVSSAFCWRY